LSIKTKLIGGISALTLAGGMLAVAGPPAGAVVTQVGSCTGLLALGSAKSSTINPGTGKPYGIADVNDIDGAIGSKGVDRTTVGGTNLGTCTFVGNQGVPDNNSKPTTALSGSDLTEPVAKWGTKLFSREFDCNTADTSDTTEWAPSGALSFTYTKLNSLGKARALTAAITVDGFTDPDNDPSSPSDVVAFHGIVSKGLALGADVDGQTEFDPTVKDKTQTTTTPYPGYQFDIAGALGCTTPAVGDANILLFNNGDNGAGASQLLGLPVSGIKFTKGTA